MSTKKITPEAKIRLALAMADDFMTHLENNSDINDVLNGFGYSNQEKKMASDSYFSRDEEINEKLSQLGSPFGVLDIEEIKIISAILKQAKALPEVVQKIDKELETLTKGDSYGR